MTDQSKESRQRAQPVGSIVLFAIGLSAGLISAAFPRVMAFMSLGEGTIDIQFFSTGYLIASGAFALIIGISMVWLYFGSRENTQHLFMAALALPAVLSGGLNMSSSISPAKATIQRLDADKSRLMNKLASLDGIREDESPFASKPAVAPPSESRIDGILPSILGISVAVAADSSHAASTDYNPEVRYKIKSERKDYVILLFSSRNKTDVEKKRQVYSRKLAGTALEIRDAGGTHFLITKDRTSRADALIEAVDIKKQLNITPSIVRAR